ncbi:MAG: MBL fold metallo-hydrolase [Actinomycetota bacterium]|nr:MBL fold metallo-hydrolase [Actinomycetota bacterium]
MFSKTKITFYGHSMFVIRSKNGINIGTDPYNEQVKSNLPDVFANVVTISHSHFDHSNLNLFKGKPKIIRETGIHDFEGISFHGFSSFHDNMRGASRGNNIIFKFEVDGIKFAHFGDYGSTAEEKTISELKDIDIIFIPVGGVYTINHREAINLINKLNPKIAIPMHFKEKDTRIEVDDINPFKNSLGAFNKVKEVGNSFEISKEELPSSTEIWIMYGA